MVGPNPLLTGVGPYIFIASFQYEKQFVAKTTSTRKINNTFVQYALNHAHKSFK